jgi:hypothetical protein
MEKVRDKVIIIMIATSTATAAALSMEYIAYYDFGFSREEIRTLALIGAVIIAALVAAEFFAERLRKLK